MCERPEQRLVAAAQELAEAEHHLEELVRTTEERWIFTAYDSLTRREDYRARRKLEMIADMEGVEVTMDGAQEMIDANP
jgi:hypothetical protein